MAETKYLDKIQRPEDVQKLNLEELGHLAHDIREEIRKLQYLENAERKACGKDRGPQRPNDAHFRRQGRTGVCTLRFRAAR